jgi:hypothetical protein
MISFGTGLFVFQQKSKAFDHYQEIMVGLLSRIVSTTNDLIGSRLGAMIGFCGGSEGKRPKNQY